MEKIKIKIIGMSYSQAQSGAYALVLGEVDGDRRIPIVIGGFEAQSIAIELEGMKPARPLTHDLLKNFADTFDIRLKEVLINKFSEGIFYAKLVCTGKDGIEYEIDSRTSDAVALAIRFECPIYTYEKIISETGVTMDEESDADLMDVSPETEEVESDDALAEVSLEELEKMIAKAIEQEDYERASVIQKEINKRK